MKTILSILLLAVALALVARAVQPPVGGVFEMAWEKALTNDVVDYAVWQSTNGAVSWRQVGSTRTNWFSFTNRNITPLTFYRVTQMPWMPSGSQDRREETEIGLLHWAPSGTNTVTNALNYVRLKAADVVPGTRVRLSSNLTLWDDWLTVRVFDGDTELSNVVVRLEHSPSAQKPKLFVGYVTNLPVAAALPPMPATQKLR